jgi:ribosomal protein L7Ae-like RNA K-turn-binding protein
LSSEDKLRALVGMAIRSRSIAVGREACKRAARRKELHVLLLAADAGGSAARDCGAGPGVRVLRAGLDKQALGALLGRESVAAIGITDAGLAAGLAQHAPPAEPD